MTKSNEPPSILRVDDLHVSFRTDDAMVQAVRGVSFEIGAGETLGVVGESGSGKSVTNLALMGLIPMPPGVIEHGTAMFDGRDLLTMPERDMQRIRGRRIGMIFQDPMTALNPLMTVGDQLTEATRWHLALDRHHAQSRAVEMLGMVGIASPEDRLRQYPHQFSGGMRQRVMIAMALSCEPDLLIADEPTTALDVTIQAQILELLQAIQKRRSISIVLITHDLGIVASVCNRVLVMYAGRIVESATTEDLFASPAHPYTRGLLASLPRLDDDSHQLLRSIPGTPPDMGNPPIGCAFRARCELAINACASEDPRLLPFREHHDAACLVTTGTASAEASS